MTQKHGQTIEEKLKQMQDEKKFLETAFHGLNEAAIVAMTDLEGTITFVNDKFTDISGYSAEELVGSNHRMLNSGYHPKEFFENMWQTIASGKTWKGEVCNRRKDGTFYWVDATILAFSQATGEPGYLAIRFDITARKQLEEQLIYNSKLASLGEMAGGLAHQLNNPLSIITGYLDVISEEVRKNTEVEAKLRKPLDRITNGIRKLSTIVAGLRIFSRSSASKYTEKTLVQRLVEDTLMLCQERYLTSQVEVLSEVPSLIFECNRAEITQVLLNLLNNSFDAVKVLPDRWIKVKVTQPNPDIIQFHVVDSGMGIPSEIASQVMQPFFTTKETGKYAGLGLSTSLGLARKYGGNLYIERTSKNTHFILELPMKIGSNQSESGSGKKKAA